MNQTLLILVLLVSICGCQSGRPPMTIEEATPSDTTEAQKEVFIFAESPFLDIDSEMMAEQFQIDNVPAAFEKIDSVTAWDAVYGMLLDSLLAEDSKDFDLQAHDPSLYDQYIKRRWQRTLRLMFIFEVKEKAEVSDSLVEATYKINIDSYTVPLEYRARHIVVAGHALKKEDSLKFRDFTDEQMDSVAYNVIGDIRRRLLEGAPFDTLAMLYSHDPRSQGIGGDLGYFQLVQMVQPFDSAVENTPVGEISGIFKTMYGWHVLRVENVSEPHVRPLDSVAAGIREQLLAEEMDKMGRVFVDSVAAEGDFALDSATLEKPDSLLRVTDPMAYVNPGDIQHGSDTIYAKQYFEQLYSFKRMKGTDGELSLADRSELLNIIATRYHLLRAARILGYADSEDMRKWSQSLYKRYSVSIMRRQALEDGFEPSDEEIEAYYQAHIDDYISERPIYVQHIIFADSNLAEHVRDILSSGADFMEMVDRYYPGDPEIKRAAADLGYIGENDMPPEFWQEARITPEGAISRPVKTEYGYHLIKVAEKDFPISLENAAGKIRTALKEDHKKNIIKNSVESRSGGSPVIYWERLDDLYRKKLPRPPLPTFTGS